MREIDDEFEQTYGLPRITVAIANRGHPVNHKRVQRLMAAPGIVGVHKPAGVRTTIPAEHDPPLPDNRRIDAPTLVVFQSPKSQVEDGLGRPGRATRISH